MIPSISVLTHSACLHTVQKYHKYRTSCQIFQNEDCWPSLWSEAGGSRIYKEHSLMFNVALRCWDKLDSQKTANVLTLLLLLSFFLLCSQFSPNIIPSREITSVEKPAMLMVAITNIKCNMLLFATRFIQQRHSLENTMQASKSVSLYFIVPKLVSWVLTS